VLAQCHICHVVLMPTQELFLFVGDASVCLPGQKHACQGTTSTQTMCVTVAANKASVVSVMQVVYTCPVTWVPLASCICHLQTH
jgi:hypothetical protein